MTQAAQPQDLKFPNEDFRAKQPEAGQIHAFSLPVMKPFALPNGIEVYLVEQHTLPLVSMDLNFDGGSLTDPKGKDGLASICTSMLTEGTEKLDKIQFSEALADVASSVNAYATDDSQGLGLASLTKHLPATFALFADTLRTPGLRQSDLDRMVKRRIEAVKQARGNPTAIPGRVADPILYGPTHPFGAITTEQSLAAITLADCKKQLATWMQPNACAAVRRRRSDRSSKSATRSRSRRSQIGKARRRSCRRCPRPRRWPAGSSSSTCRTQRSRRCC